MWLENVPAISGVLVLGPLLFLNGVGLLTVHNEWVYVRWCKPDITHCEKINLARNDRTL